MIGLGDESQTFKIASTKTAVFKSQVIALRNKSDKVASPSPKVTVRSWVPLRCTLDCKAVFENFVRASKFSFGIGVSYLAMIEPFGGGQDIPRSANTSLV